jgi:hypothetical protein
MPISGSTPSTRRRGAWQPWKLKHTLFSCRTGPPRSFPPIIAILTRWCFHSGSSSVHRVKCKPSRLTRSHTLYCGHRSPHFQLAHLHPSRCGHLNSGDLELVWRQLRILGLALGMELSTASHFACVGSRSRMSESFLTICASALPRPCNRGSIWPLAVKRISIVCCSLPCVYVIPTAQNAHRLFHAADG